MTKRAMLILGIVALILISFSLVPAQRAAISPQRTATPIPADQIAPVKAPPMAKDECYLWYTQWAPAYFHNNWKYGDKVAIYFDPEDCGYPVNYPFQLTDVEFYLYDFAPLGACSLRFSVEVVCPDICDGPGIEIWKSRTYNITTFFPDIVTIYFDDTVCVDKPFFFNVEFLQGPQGSVPSLLFDDETAIVDTCYQWVWLGQPAWLEWYDFWVPYTPPGWVNLSISGLVDYQADCGWWYWKPDTLPQAPSGMPDFDQNQRNWAAYCGPTAVANCLWWFDAVPTAGMDPADFIELLAGYFGTTSGGTYVDSIQLGLEEYFNDYGFALKETTYWMPDFYEMEDSLKVCQDIILLLGFWWYEEGPEQEFVRGDVNADGWIDALDLGTLITGPPYLCDDAADVNDDGALDDLDSAYLWDYMFYGGSPPPPPFPDCGVDPTADALDCADFPPCPGGGGEWYREGGHFVTMAGVNSEKKEIAISDPDRDQKVRYSWWPGRVRMADHLPWGAYDGAYHNDPRYVSHDVYISLLFPEFPSPGSDVWDLADYCYGQTFPMMNVPHRFEAYSRAAPKHFEYFHTEVEAAIMICPKPSADTLPNHFKTWRIQPEPFSQIVVVEDQFMFDTLYLEDIEFFSNPARKDSFEIVDNLEHLTWYGAQGRNTLLEVEYRNQFGTYTNKIGSVKYLLLPTAKESDVIPDSLDHYKAYRIKDPVTFDRQLVLEDQFDIMYGAPEDIDSLKPIYFLTPALKDYEEPWLFDSVTHFVAYEIFPKRLFSLLVNTLDQFGWHDLYVEQAEILLVPSEKLRVTVPESLYWKPPYGDYAPSGMPDIDQKQDNWMKAGTGAYTFCGPVAVANCFKWFDSKYNVPPGAPGDGMDQFPLVRDYMDNLAPFIAPAWDDHDPWNVDHAGTPWGPPADPPPATVQPFVPGPQPQPSTMPPWGELVERLAWYFNTDGIQTGYCQFSGTNVYDMQDGIEEWFLSEQFEDGSTIADSLYEYTIPMPTFAEVETLVEMCEDVILLLGFWYQEGPEQEFIRGDVDADGWINVMDIQTLMNGPPYLCDDAADVNDDGALDNLDSAYLWNYIFMGGPPPPPPFPDCGTDPTYDNLGCGDFPPCPPSGTGEWWRCGGHYVTVAGVNSQDLLIAIADPFFDNAEAGGLGRIGDGTLIPHPHGNHDGTVHNDEGNVSHDIYSVSTDPVSPAGLWELVGYPVSLNPGYCYDFSEQNIPPEFETMTQPWNGTSPIFTEIEYAVVISPRNHPPEIIQPDSLEGFIDDTVTYTFDGIDPNGDVILDAASLQIVPSCGTYSVTRIAGHGTSTGTWRVTWDTDGCTACTTYRVIVDLTDEHGATSYCTTYVHLSSSRECDPNDPKECDTLYVECGNMLVPPGGGLVTVNLSIAYDETLSAVQVPLSYEGSPECCDSMPDNENTVAQVFAGSIVPGSWIKIVNIDHLNKKVVVAGVSIMQPTDCLLPGRGHLGTLTLLGDSCCTIQLDTTDWSNNHVGFVDCNDPTNTLFYPVCRIDTCHIDRNYPPEIGQPDFLEGYVDSIVEYEITGSDPDGDVILDDASIDIQPGCGSYSIVRTSGHGTSSGTWQITWDTDGCTPCDTHMVIHDLTDANGLTSYCTTWVHLSSPKECDHNDPHECDTLYVECGNMLVPPGGGLVKVNMSIAYDESLSAFQVPLSYQGSPICCDSMPDSENTVGQVFAGSIIPGSWIKIVNIDHQAKEVVVAGVALTPPSDCLMPGRGHLGTLTLFGDSCCTIQLDTTDYAGNHVGFVDCNDPAGTLFYPVCRIDTCHIDRNYPPEIGQPDFLEGYVDHVVIYTITGNDPDGDVIQDSASIDIQPGCGSAYYITRISGHGTSSGTWEIRWFTDGCTPCDTHMVIHDLTDANGFTSYCTTWVHLSESWPDHKMHYPQLPDPEGWDIVATLGYEMHPGIVAADDFMCTETGLITDIYFWGSWFWDDVAPIHGFYLSIHENIPAPPYSRPGEELWSAYVTDFEMTPEDPGLQGWYDPFLPAWEHPNHLNYFRYDITDIPNPFCQDSGTIYWLNIMADLGPPGYMGVPEPPLWGWKTSASPHFEDDAVWAIFTPPVYDWVPLMDPITGETLDLSFVITGKYICGDASGDGVVGPADVVYLINYLFRPGSPPPCPLAAGDVNCDGVVTAADIVYMLNYLFKQPWPDPCDPDGDGIPDC